MATVMRAEVALSAQNGLKPGLAAAARDLERFRQLQNRAAASMRGQEVMERVGGAFRTGLGALGVAGGAAGAAQAVTRFAQVERSMTRIAITGDAAQSRVAGMTSEMRDLAYQTALPFEQLQKGMESLTASGLSVDQAMKMLPSVARTAQAAGADVGEVATSSQAMMEHFKNSVEQLSEAQDILAKGGKLGKFELKDMARYLPSILPAAKAVGLSGTEGLGNLVSMLQVIRAGSGSAEEAASSMQNIFAKMESEATVKNFKDMGVDLPKALAKARREGRDLLTTFIDLSQQATRGDLSKLPQLFPDMEFSRGMRALMSMKDRIGEFRAELRSAAGTIDADFNRVIGNTASSMDRMKLSADRLVSAIGQMLANKFSEFKLPPALEKLASVLEMANRISEGQNAIDARNTADPAGAAARQQKASDALLADWRNRKAQQELESIRATGARLDSASQFPPGSAAARLAAGSDAAARAALANRVTGPVIATMTGMPEPFAFSPSSLDPRLRRPADFDEWRQQSPNRGAGKPVNIPLPQARPDGLPLVQGLDEAAPKAAQIVTEVNKIGPAGQQAGQQIVAAAAEAESAWARFVINTQARLNTLKVPNGAAAGAMIGGFNTGKSMREIE